MGETGLEIADLEEELGFPRGWTSVDGASNEIRAQMIRTVACYVSIDPIFIKYLNKDRLGNPR